ncbi:MAG TPA: 30S ribosomal protein S6 [Propionibacteriaceae bacterium]|nr:30S ribosomal protein S6 [Propionibacteriaceae bacterium]HEX2855966.1 30S ribosomal protein S6 [Propionibacteriaceae bacterium]
MRKYEVMVIVDPEVDDRQVSPLIDKHLQTVTTGGGTVDNIDVWGRRRLAYDINKKSEGVYVVINLTAEPALVKEFDRLMTIDEQIMRTKVLRPDAH